MEIRTMNTTNTKKFKRGRSGENDETPDTITILIEQIENEREQSKQLHDEIKQMRIQLQTMTNSIKSLNEIISNLQIENKRLISKIIDNKNQNIECNRNKKKKTKQKKSPNTATTQTQQAVSGLHIPNNIEKHTTENSTSTIIEQHNATTSTNVNTTIETIENNAPNDSASMSEQSTNCNEDDVNGASDENDDDFESSTSIISDDETESSSFTFKRKNSIPPIDVWTKESTTVQNRLNEALPKYSCVYSKINNAKFRIFTKSLEIRKKVIEYLSKRGYQFNSYTPKDEKMINILIKNTDIDDADYIKNELKEIGIIPVKIQRHTTGYMRKNNIQSKIWHLVLAPKTDTKILFNTKNIGYHIVKYEFMKKPEITQCKRCQRFNHAASSCFLPYRCVKCAGEHQPGECPLNTNDNITKPKCANCNGDHTANDAKQCNVFKKAIEIMKEKKAKKEKEKNGKSITVKSNEPRKTMSSLFNSTKTENINTATTPIQPWVTKQSPIELFIQQQQAMMNEFLGTMMKCQQEFIKRSFNGSV